MPTTTNKSHESNFAVRLLDRLGKNSRLIDATTGEDVGGSDVCGKAAGFAAWFRAAALERGDRIVVACTLTPASALAYLGAMYAGLVPVLVDERLLETSGSLAFAKAKAKAVWTNKGRRCDWATKSEAVHFEGYPDSHDYPRLEPAMVADDDVAAIMPTSGSTSVPRLVMVTHKNLIANTEAIVRSQQLKDKERALLIMPISYCFGASVLHTHLYQSGSVVFDSRFMFPDKVLRTAETYGCTTFAGVPSVYSILIRRSNFGSFELETLRRFLQAGGALGSDKIGQICDIFPRKEFFVMYGQTEATARVSCFRASHAPERIGSVGLPLDNLELCVVDEEGEPLPNDSTGEIWVKGPSVCRGYMDDPLPTNLKFVDGWLRTDDFGSVDANGYLWLKGRADDFVKIRGVRVSVGEVEARIQALSGVYECAAIAMQHPEAGEALRLFIVADRAKAAEALMQKVRHALSPQWTCGSVSFVSELPKTANGKVARSQLRALI